MQLITQLKLQLLEFPCRSKKPEKNIKNHKSKAVALYCVFAVKLFPVRCAEIFSIADIVELHLDGPYLRINQFSIVDNRPRSSICRLSIFSPGYLACRSAALKR